MPRRQIRQILKKVRPPTPVTMNVKPVKPPLQKKQLDPEKCDPETFSKYSTGLYRRLSKAIQENKPHFLLGGKEVYFPWAPVTLLRPSARMTPFQAQFQVPKTFNKLDFRDYLWNLYGLRALRITTQISWSQWARSRGPRFRTPQKKKMIIDMEKPFIWPEESPEVLKSYNIEFNKNMETYSREMQRRSGSDLKKPLELFEGILGPYPEAPKSFIPKRTKMRMANVTKRAAALAERQSKLQLIEKYSFAPASN